MLTTIVFIINRISKNIIILTWFYNKYFITIFIKNTFKNILMVYSKYTRLIVLTAVNMVIFSGWALKWIMG